MQGSVYESMWRGPCGCCCSCSVFSLKSMYVTVVKVYETEVEVPCIFFLSSLVIIVIVREWDAHVPTI